MNAQLDIVEIIKQDEWGLRHGMEVNAQFIVTGAYNGIKRKYVWIV